jgi:hypothetical protein
MIVAIGAVQLAVGERRLGRRSAEPLRPALSPIPGG